MLLNVDVSAQQIMGPYIVPSFTTYLNCMFSVFPTGDIISFSLSCKFFCVFGS